MPAVDKDVLHIMSIYNKCRNNNALPCAGGVLDQPAWIMGLFEVIDNQKSEFNKAQNERAEVEAKLHGR